MGAPGLAVRLDWEAGQLRQLARRERDGRVTARLLAIATGLDGMNRTAAAQVAGLDRQTLRDWVIRSNENGPEGLRDRPRSGRKPRLDEGQQAALKAVILRGPCPEKDGVSRWRIKDLCRIAAERFGGVDQPGGMLRRVRGLNLSWQKTRPRHPRANAAEQKAFKGGIWRAP
jgi:transposase